MALRRLLGKKRLLLFLLGGSSQEGAWDRIESMASKVQQKSLRRGVRTFFSSPGCESDIEAAERRWTPCSSGTC